MSATQKISTEVMEAPPEMALLQLVTGYWVSQAIYVAARLGIADLLKDGAKSSEELAAATGTHAPTLYRLMRALVSVGLFTETDGGRFELTPVGAALQSSAGSARSMTIHLLEKPSWQAWGELMHSVRTGETGFLHAHGMEVFPYYSQHPESAAPFNEAMTELSKIVCDAVARAYDFSPYAKVVDVGGGHGSLLAAILKASPQTEGVLFDIPQVVEGARRGPLAAEELAGRAEIVEGDFFTSVPEGGDAYVMKHIIHDWDDERAIVILKNINRVIKPGGKLLLIEQVITPDGGTFSTGSDLHMLIMTGGRERTEEEYRTLFAAAGFELTRVVPTESLVSLVEGVKPLA